MVERNVRWMAEATDAAGVTLRPHFKTSKCLPVADLQRRHGAHGLTVSTLDEARAVLAGDDHRGIEPWTDVTWAFPLIPGRVDEALDLARSSSVTTPLGLLVDSETAVDALEDRIRALAWAGTDRPLRLRVAVEIDCGQHRSGIDLTGDGLSEGSGFERVLALARRLEASSTLAFDGLLSHSGHAYTRPGLEPRLAAAEQERSVMAGCADRLRDAGIPVKKVSIGSTPSLTAALGQPERMPHGQSGVTEVRPGNYVFFDETQVALGSCTEDDTALRILTSVVSCPAAGDRSVIDAGALSLSKDAGPSWLRPTTYGRVLEGGRVRSLSQEHGLVDRPHEVGRRLRVAPNHSCLVVPHFREYTVVRGDRVVDRWPIVR